MINRLIKISLVVFAAQLLFTGAFAQDNLKTELIVQTGHTQSVDSVAFSSNGMMLASGSWDKTVKLWDVSSGQELSTLKGHTEAVNSVTFSPDGRMLASGSGDETIKLWDVERERAIRTVLGHDDSVSSVVFSPDGKLLASGSGDEMAKLWDVKSGQELRTLSGDSDSVYSVVFSPDGELLALGSRDETIKLWDMKSGKELRALSGHNDWVTSIGFSSNGKMLASGSRDMTIKLWDVKSGQELRTLSGHIGVVSSVAFSSDGEMLASGSSDETIKLWDVKSGSLLKSYAGDDPMVTNEVLSVVPGFLDKNPDFEPVTPDGGFQIKISENGKLNLFEVKSGRLLASLIAFDEKDWVVITPGGIFDGSPNGWKKLIWRLDNNTFNFAPVEAFYNEFYRPALLQDIFAGKEIEPLKRELSTIDIRQPLIRVTAFDNQTVDPFKPISVKNKTGKARVEITDNTAEKRRANFPASSDARDVRLFRNGSLVKLWENNAFALTEKHGCKQFPATDKSPRKAVCETDVQITAGQNEFSAYAFNHNNVKSYDAIASVTGDFPKRDGTLYILAVGVNNYANSNYNLRYAVPDAQELSDQLKLQQQKLDVYKKQEIILLKDDEATKANLLYALERFSRGDQAKSPDDLKSELKENLARIKISQPEDAILVYFSGHGFADKDRFYLIPHDLGVTEEVERVTEQKLKALREQSISDIELEERFREINAGQLLLIIDACNSGQALETSDEKRRGPMNSRGLAQLAYEKGMYILTASESFQYARETSNLKHGALTYALLEGMKGGRKEDGLKPDADGDGQIFEREWFSYATQIVPKLLDQKYKEKSVPVKEAGKKYGSIQTPRVFYRRETNANPLLVARF